MSAYDAVVVGAGPNGLAAAVALAQQGWSVLVREAQETIGGGTRSAELTLPGFVHDICSAVHPLGIASPFFSTLPLADHGLEWVHPAVPLAHPFDDGTAALLERTIAATGATLGSDAEAYHALVAPFVDSWPELIADVLAPLGIPRHPLLLARFGLRGLRSARGLAESTFNGEAARALFAGMAAHSAVRLTASPTAAFGLTLGITGHGAGWPVARGGSQRIADALAAYFKALGGEIVTGAPVTTLDELPPARAILLDLTPRQVLEVGGRRLPERYRRALERYRYGPGTFKIDWALSEPIPWTAPGCARAGTVHLGGTLDELIAAEDGPWNGEHPEQPFVLLGQPSLADATRAPAGMHTGWAYCHVPHGSAVDMTARIERQVERFAPGFRETILARHVMPPAVLERHNANLVGGDISGGVMDLRQLFFRPKVSLTPYATPARGLYICSSSTPPGGAVHGMCGYHAAQTVLARHGGSSGARSAVPGRSAAIAAGGTIPDGLTPATPEPRMHSPKSEQARLPKDSREAQAPNRGGDPPVHQMEMEAGHGAMTPKEGDRMLLQHHRQMLWAPFLVVVLGVWLVSNPLTLGYPNPELAGSDVERITAVRDLAPVAARGAAMMWSDIASGILLIVLGLLSLDARRLWAPWAACAVGIWLLFAPLVLWAPTAAAYGHDTIIGALVIALTVLIPGMPGMMLMMTPGPEVPPGWSYNPSSWVQRAPIIVLAWAGFFLSRHLAAYQLGYLPSAWDPIFGEGTMRVLDSDVSRAFPISDAGLGVVAYAIEALMGYMGGPSRWRTMPWMVTFFGILVVPLGTVSIFLIIMQPVAVGEWCTLCLATALGMLIMIPLALDEVVAMGQFLARSRREGKSLWRTFWMGGTVEGGSADERSPRLTARPGQTIPAMAWGVAVPWTLAASTLLGVWMMAAPAVLGGAGAIVNSSVVAGALVTTVAVTAMADVARALRFANVVLGGWLAAAPWILEGATAAGQWNGVAAGVLIIALSIPRGPVRERYAGWQRLIV